MLKRVTAALGLLVAVSSTASAQPNAIGGEFGIGAAMMFEGDPEATPEPASLALIGTGLLAIAGIRMRRRA